MDDFLDMTIEVINYKDETLQMICKADIRKHIFIAKMVENKQFMLENYTEVMRELSNIIIYMVEKNENNW